MITLKEIAEMAGVHKSTVDKVVHNRAGVSDEVRQKIQKLLDEYEYRPNQAARALQYQKKPLKIGVVLIQVDAFTMLKTGIERGLAEFSHYRTELELLSVPFEGSAAMANHIYDMVEQKYDGIIVSPINSEPVRQAMRQASECGIPVVTVNSDLEFEPKLCHIGQGGTKASWAAGRMMGEMTGGSGKIAVITSAVAAENNNYYTKIRESSFIDYIQKNYPDLTIVSCIESMEDIQITRKETELLLQREPDLCGIYITCGGVAEVGEAVKAAGKAGKIKVIGFESYPSTLEMIRQDCVTCTVDTDIEQQGVLAVRVLMDYLVNQKKPQTDVQSTDIKFVLKELL